MIVFASKNKGKLAEVREILEPFEITIETREDLPEVEETGKTFEENAILKAKSAAAATEMPALADDSGLEVDALGGAPGVKSARYSGKNATDELNMKKVLLQLENSEIRTARFVCVIAFALPNGKARTVRGTCEGVLLRAPRGDGGFGYDPIFLPMGLDETFGELDPMIKNQISHRASALEQLPELIANTLSV